VTLCSRLSRNCATLLSSPLVALLEALAFELEALLPSFFEDDLEDDFELDFEVAFLALVALAFVFDFVDFAALAAFDVFDFAAAFGFALLPLDLPLAFFSAI
jgi:hypothetical protein